MTYAPCDIPFEINMSAETEAFLSDNGMPLLTKKLHNGVKTKYTPPEGHIPSRQERRAAKRKQTKEKDHAC